MNDVSDELKRCANEAIRVHELYPYNRIRKEIFKQDAKVQNCKLSIITGLSLQGYCEYKMELMEEKGYRLGTDECLKGRELITDKMLEKIVDRSISAYNEVFSESISEPKYTKFSWDAVFKRPQRIIDSFFDNAIYTFIIYILYRVLLSLDIINPL